MEFVGYTDNQLVGLRVVRGPNWEWDTQDGGEGFVGTVTAAVGNIQNSRRVKVRWDLGQQFIYRIGDEKAYDLRVLDSSTVGVKHPGVKCRGCGQKEIAGMRWQCFDCPTPSDLCTFCFVNGKHDQTHVNFRRYCHQSSKPIVFRLDHEKRKVQLKGFFLEALVRRGDDWNYSDEDGGSRSYGKVVQGPNGREMTPGKVRVQWPDEEEPILYRAGFSGKMDLKIAEAAIGGQYQPDTLPVLEIFKPRADDEKTNEAVADPPFVIGDRVKLAVGLEQLREMVVDSGMRWNGDERKKVVKAILTIREIDNKDNTVKVISSKWGKNGFWLPVKALRRSIPWLPVGAVVQVIDKSHSNGIDMQQDVMAGEFGRVKQVSLDGKTVDMEFFTSDGNVTKTVDVDQLEDKFVDVSVIEKVDFIRKELAKLLLSEVEKESILSVQFLLKRYPDIIDCQSFYNGKNSTALSVACQKGNMEMVKLLLTHKASLDIADEEDVPEALANSPIHHAVLGNHPEILRLLLQNGASSNEINKNKRTPLHLAAMEGHVECIRVLLEDEQCDLNLEDFDKKTAFRLAVKSSVQSVQSVELFNLFHATGKWNNTFAERWFLNLAIENDNLGAIKVLLSCPEGKKLARDFSKHDDKALLYVACSGSHNQIAKLLVSEVDKDENGKPWDIDSPDKKGITPLMKVVEKLNCELIELLIGAGANLQATDEDGDTPFHYAARLFREKVTTFEGTKKGETNFITWPNQETAPEIFKLYNELKIKHPGKNLCPVATIVYFLVKKGGIPQNLTDPDIKRLIGDNFLYEEITKIRPDPNSMPQNSQGSHPIEMNEINREQSTEVGDEPAKTSELQRDRQRSNPKSYGRVESENEPVTVMTSLQDPLPSQSGVATGESATGPIAQRRQQRNSRSFPSIPNENVPGSTVTPTRDAAANTNDDGYLDSDGSDSVTTDVSFMGKTMNNQRVPFNDQPTAESSIDNSVPGNSRLLKEVTCTIEKNTKRKEHVSAEENISWIIIDEKGRRYSQTKVRGTFQCTANVESSTKSNGFKKCKGTVFVKDLNAVLGEWEINPEKQFIFTVRNPHEDHLKRKRKPCEKESDTPSTSSKRRK